MAWDPNTDGNTSGYVVQGGIESGVYTWGADVGGATTAPLPPLPPGASYYFIVRAYNAAGDLGPASNEAVIDLGLPGRPVGVTASAAGVRATLSWAAPVSGARVTQYLVSVGTQPGRSDLLSALPVGVQRSVSGDVPPGRYFARVQAMNGFGVGPASDEVSFVVGSADQPGAPSGLTVGWQGPVATFRWSPGSGATAYLLEAGTAPGASNVGFLNVGGAPRYSVDVPAGTYYVRVRSLNAAGGLSSPSNEITVQRPSP